MTDADFEALAAEITNMVVFTEENPPSAISLPQAVGRYAAARILEEVKAEQAACLEIAEEEVRWEQKRAKQQSSLADLERQRHLDMARACLRIVERIRERGDRRQDMGTRADTVKNLGGPHIGGV